MNRKKSPNVRLTFLFQRVAVGKATVTEKKEFMMLMAEPENEEQAEELMRIHWEGFDSSPNPFTSGGSREMLEKVMLRIDSPDTVYTPEKKLFSWFSWGGAAAAACLLALLVAAGYFLYRPVPGFVAAEEDRYDDIAPGTDKAFLTLSDGKKIALDDVPVGVLIDDADFEVRKSEDGMLEYHRAGKQHTPIEVAGSHTISTPRGGKYRIILPDGSRVWLNAASSLRYPVRFNDSGRMVELTGEAYFEIVPARSEENQQRVGFRVIAGKQIVDVLGTHFNISSYSDEETARTTLLEGSIRISGTGHAQSLLLKPGQQCIPRPSGGFHVLEHVNVNEAVAWKKNQFSFNGLAIQGIMRQLARWYDIDVQYSGHIPEEHLTGYVSRDVPLSRVLQMLEKISELKFVLDGRTVIVSASPN